MFRENLHTGRDPDGSRRTKILLRAIIRDNKTISNLLDSLREPRSRRSVSKSIVSSNRPESQMYIGL